MRRIIERTVTIVTTTIWRISWQDDTLNDSRHSQSDLATDEFPKPDISPEPVKRTEQFPPVIEAKEVDLRITKPVSKQTIDEISDDSNFY
jgi:hypothetical protein